MQNVKTAKTFNLSVYVKLTAAKECLKSIEDLPELDKTEQVASSIQVGVLEGPERN